MIVSIALIHYIFHIGNYIVRRKRGRVKREIKRGIQKKVLVQIAPKVLSLKRTEFNLHSLKVIAATASNI